MIKKIYAVVSDKDFYLFRKKAYAQQLTFGEALAALAVAFGKGEIELKKFSIQSKKLKEDNPYLKDHKGGTQNITKITGT